MRKTLTTKDIKELRYQCRMGYIIPSMLFVIGTALASGVYELNFNDKTGINWLMILFIALLIGMLSFFIGYRMNWKYISDIKSNEKVVEAKNIQKKELKRDYEAGSGTLFIGQEMNGFDSFSIIVDNYRYRVEKDLFFNSSEGDEVYFNYGPTSKYLINIELKQSNNKKS